MAICNRSHNRHSPIRRGVDSQLPMSIVPSLMSSTSNFTPAEFCRVSLPSVTIVHNTVHDSVVSKLSYGYGERLGPTVLVHSDGRAPALFQPTSGNAITEISLPALDVSPKEVNEGVVSNSIPHSALLACSHLGDIDKTHAYRNYLNGKKDTPKSSNKVIFPPTLSESVIDPPEPTTGSALKNSENKSKSETKRTIYSQPSFDLGDKMDYATLDPTHTNFYTAENFPDTISLADSSTPANQLDQTSSSSAVNAAQTVTDGTMTAVTVDNSGVERSLSDSRFTIIDEQYKDTSNDTTEESDCDEFNETHLTKSASGCSLSIRFSRARNALPVEGGSRSSHNTLTNYQSTALRRELYKNSASTSNLQHLLANNNNGSLQFSPTAPAGPVPKMNVVERFKVSPVRSRYKLGRWECCDYYDTARAASIPESSLSPRNPDRPPMMGDTPKSGSLPPIKKSVIFRVDSTRSDFFTPHANGEEKRRKSTQGSAIPLAIVTPPSVTNGLTPTPKNAPASQTPIQISNTIHQQKPATIAYPATNAITYNQPATVTGNFSRNGHQPNSAVTFGISTTNSPSSSMDHMEQCARNPPHSPVCFTPSSTSSLRMEEEQSRFTFDDRNVIQHNEELQTEIRNQLAYLIQQKQQEQQQQQQQQQHLFRQNSNNYHYAHSSLRDLLSNFPTSTGPAAIVATHGTLRKIGSHANVLSQQHQQQLQHHHDLSHQIHRQPSLNYHDLERSLHAATTPPVVGTTSAYMRSQNSPTMTRGNSMIETTGNIPMLTVTQHAHASPLRNRGYSDSRAVGYYRCNSGNSECDSECDSEIFDLASSQYAQPQHPIYMQPQQIQYQQVQPHQQLLQAQHPAGRLTPSMKYSSRMGKKLIMMKNELDRIQHDRSIRLLSRLGGKLHALSA